MRRTSAPEIAGSHVATLREAAAAQEGVKTSSLARNKPLSQKRPSFEPDLMMLVTSFPVEILDFAVHQICP